MSGRRGSIGTIFFFSFFPSLSPADKGVEDIREKQGMPSRVRVCRDKSTDHMYAIKKLEKLEMLC
ncbi:hypothetical protein BDE02_12G024500 [Populus trichocarpa]|nr:hypothetical protein BDE02_12G024500 [Populus trichocarpa]